LYLHKVVKHKRTNLTADYYMKATHVPLKKHLKLVQVKDCVDRLVNLAVNILSVRFWIKLNTTIFYVVTKNKHKLWTKTRIKFVEIKMKLLHDIYQFTFYFNLVLYNSAH